MVFPIFKIYFNFIYDYNLPSIKLPWTFPTCTLTQLQEPKEIKEYKETELSSIKINMKCKNYLYQFYLTDSKLVSLLHPFLLKPLSHTNLPIK